MKKAIILIIMGLMFMGCTVKVYKIQYPDAYPMIHVPFEQLEKQSQPETPWDTGEKKYMI